MMLSRVDIDRAYLRRALTVPLAVLGIAVLALTGSYFGRARIAAQSAIEQQELATLDQQRLELASRLEARQAYQERFAAIDAAGVIGGEQRLAWAQALRQAANDLRLPYLRYSAAPQREFAADYLVPGVAAPVMATTMELQVGLVHEVDLLRLFDHLRAAAPGMFSVTGCALERAAGNAPPETDKANITATCKLRWFSIPHAGAAVAAEDGA